MKDDLAVGVGLECSFLILEVLAQDAVVVDFSVDCQDELAIGADQRLSAGVWVEKAADRR